MYQLLGYNYEVGSGYFRNCPQLFCVDPPSFLLSRDSLNDTLAESITLQSRSLLEQFYVDTDDSVLFLFKLQSQTLLGALSPILPVQVALEG